VVKDLFRELARRAGKTIFICSHILPVIEELCDRVGIISQGRLIAVGTVDEIIAQTGARTLEEAYISITGGVEEKELLSWRREKGADA
jgi:ABC-2 type transport system ATP-binding protein